MTSNSVIFRPNLLFVSSWIEDLIQTFGVVGVCVVESLLTILSSNTKIRYNKLWAYVYSQIYSRAPINCLEFVRTWVWFLKIGLVIFGMASSHIFFNLLENSGFISCIARFRDPINCLEFGRIWVWFLKIGLVIFWHGSFTYCIYIIFQENAEGRRMRLQPCLFAGKQFKVKHGCLPPNWSFQ